MKKLLFINGLLLLLGTQVHGQTESKGDNSKLKISESKINNASAPAIESELKMKATSKDTLNTKLSTSNFQKSDIPKLQSHSQIINQVNNQAVIKEEDSKTK